MALINTVTGAGGSCPIARLHALVSMEEQWVGTLGRFQFGGRLTNSMIGYDQQYKSN